MERWPTTEEARKGTTGGGETLSTRKAREIRARIDHQLDRRERGIHAGLIEYALAEGRAREGRIKQRN